MTAGGRGPMGGWTQSLVGRVTLWLARAGTSPSDRYCFGRSRLLVAFALRKWPAPPINRSAAPTSARILNFEHGASETLGCLGALTCSFIRLA